MNQEIPGKTSVFGGAAYRWSSEAIRAQNPIRIEIPKGSYVPAFTEGPARESSSNSTVIQPRARKCTASWPSVLVMPFEDLTGNPDLPYLSVGLATELCVELGHCEDLRKQWRVGALICRV